MKKLLLISFLLLSCCCKEPLTENQLENSGLIKTFEIVYHHTENCGGHKRRFGKTEFQLEGHDMWYIRSEDSASGGPFILHSPDCEKCKSGSTKVESNSEESISDYWGW